MTEVCIEVEACLKSRLIGGSSGAGEHREPGIKPFEGLLVIHVLIENWKFRIECFVRVAELPSEQKVLIVEDEAGEPHHADDEDGMHADFLSLVGYLEVDKAKRDSANRNAAY